MTPKLRPSAKTNALEKYHGEIRSENPRNISLPRVAAESRDLAPEFQIVSKDRRRFGEISKVDSGPLGRSFALERYHPAPSQEAAFPSGARRIFSLVGDFARRAFEAWSRGPHGLLLMGAGFLLGPGQARRYFEIDHSFEIPMENGDAHFVLGGKVPGAEPPHLLLEGGAPLAAKQVEIFRIEDELFVRGLTAEPGNWLMHEYKWKRLEVGKTERLRASDTLVLGLNVEPSQFKERSRELQPAVLSVDFGDGQGSFRLRPFRNGLAGWAAGYPFFASRYPVFAGPPNPRADFRLKWGERWDLWRSRGLDRLAYLLHFAEIYRFEMPQWMQRKFLEEAVSIAERAVTKLHKSGTPLADRTAEEMVLAKALHAAGAYWRHHGDFHLAEQFYERGLATLQAQLETQVEARKMQNLIGENLHSLHDWAAGYELNQGRTTEAARHYEGAAKYLRFATRYGPDDETPPLYEPPLSAGEYLSRAAGYYLAAGPEYAEDLLRVTETLKTLQNKAPFR